MKSLLIPLCMLIASSVTLTAQNVIPTARLTVRVVDEKKVPVENATVGVSFELPSTNGAGVRVQGQQATTNKEGIANFEGKTVGGYVSCGARMNGYYLTNGIVYVFSGKKDGRYLPENPTVDVVLKKIGDPIPMYARKVATEIPAVDQVIGFDLMIGDWVAPHGRGLRGDLLCKVVRRFVNWKDHDVALEITFPNEKDGLFPIIEKTPPTRGSELRLPRAAPEDGYQNRLITGIRRQPGGPSNEDARPEMNYFFRVRTVLDEKGSIKSALYGKMHGDIRLDPINSKTCFIIFDSYLNPTSNDRNVEWDRSRDLAAGLTNEQRPSAP